MITKERRSRLREQWETESGYADEWRAQLTEERLPWWRSGTGPAARKRTGSPGPTGTKGGGRRD